MLRASCDANDLEFKVASVVDNTIGNEVTHQAELIAFADALLQGERGRLNDAREQLREVVGDNGVIRAAGAVANFQMMNRALDTLGAQLGKGLSPAMQAMADDLSMAVPPHWLKIDD